jgi:2',3'-cyclic-nucleotide 2'-phosphodiesterase
MPISEREPLMSLKILFIGDVVGAAGRKIVSQVLPRLIPRWGIGLVVCNAENAAGGSGLTLRCFEELVEAGVDVMTMGDHVYRKDEIFQIFERSDRALRPANFPAESPGPELALVNARDGTLVAVFTVLGRTYMRPVDCPFHAADRILEQIGTTTRVIVVDIHAEATSDKQLLGRYLDGRVSAALGTHTHVATADEQVLPQGTAYQTDVGMTGPHDSILGRRYDRVLLSTLTFVPTYFDVATGDPRLSAALVTVVPETGRALSIHRVSIRQEEALRFLTESPDEPREPTTPPSLSGLPGTLPGDSFTR